MMIPAGVFIGPKGDPYFANVQLLLHGDGADGTTTFTDSSSFARTIIRAGNAQISTTQSKFGGASMRFDGVGDYAFSDNVVASVGSGDVTIELWVNWSGLTTNDCVVDFRSVEGNNEPLIATSTSVSSGWRVQINNADRMTTTGLVTGQWYHIAVTRASGVWRAFLNGVQFGSNFNSATNLFGNDVTIGAFRGGRNTGDGFQFNGYIDDLRYTVGVARYTSNFAVPSSAFPDS